MAYDPVRGASLVVGGQGTGGEETCQARESEDGTCVRSWSYRPRRARPHLVPHFDLRGTDSLEPSAADPTSRRVVGIEVRTRAGGRGHTAGTGRADGEPVDGFDVAVGALGFGGWIPLGTSEASPEGRQEWRGEFSGDWTCGEPWCAEATPDHWQAPDGRLYLDLAPRLPRGASHDLARIELDHVELRLSYWRTGCMTPTLADPEGSPDGTPCQDGRPETDGETCQQGRCVAP